VRDSEQKIARPRQLYIGEETRHWLPVAQRPEPSSREDAVTEQI
jgi:hypothetical protein